MNKMRAVLAILSLLILAGCTAPMVVPPTPSQLEIVDMNLGWVQVRIAGVPTTGHKILWGDIDTPYGITSVAPSEALYEHFYQAVLGPRSGEQIPTEYQITLIDEDGNIVGQASIWVELVVCHLKLVRLEGREITVDFWGRSGIDYSISWGDHSADHFSMSESAKGTISHTYAAAGTYSLGMEEIWAPQRIFFTITVE